MSNNDIDTDASEVWAEIFPVGEGWDFHFKFRNGRIAGHNYDTEEGAGEGLADLLNALTDGIQWNLETRILRKANDG